MKISLIIPIYNEEQSISELFSEIKSTFEGLYDDYEVIFVDDGSTDKTQEILESIKKGNKILKIITLNKNYGKSQALSAGISSADGDIIATLDGDLQDDPSDLKGMIELIIKKDNDLVNGWRKKRKDNFIKLLLSLLYNKLIEIVSGIKFHDFNCGIKVFTKNVAQELIGYSNLHRFIPVIAYWRGFNIDEREVNHRPRKFGKSKYGLGRGPAFLGEFINLFVITRYTVKIYYIILALGVILCIIGAVILTYLTILWFKGFALSARPLLHLGVLLVILGFQTVLVSGLVVSVVLSRRKEHYRIKEIVK